MLALGLLGVLFGCTAKGVSEAPDGSHVGATSDSAGSDSAPGDSGIDLAGPRGLLVAQSWDDATVPTATGAGEYNVILLQESMYTLLPAIRAVNPDALILAYQKVGGMRADGDAHPSTGVRTDEAAESWFLHDAAGNRLKFCDYAGVWAANVGNDDYRARWRADVQARVTADGFDGVMMDDTNTFPGHCLGSLGTSIAEYPTDEAYGDATVGFVAAVGPTLKSAGLLVAPNIGMNPWDATMLAQSEAMLPYISAWMREYWMRWDDSANFVGVDWQATFDTMTAAQSAGVAYYALTYGPGAEGAVAGERYGRASWLLAWDGVSDTSWGYYEGSGDPYSAEWGPDIGLPVEDAVLDGVVWVRRYSGGIVVVNPSTSDGATVELGGTYLDPELGAVTSVTLGTGEGRVLVGG